MNPYETPTAEQTYGRTISESAFMLLVGIMAGPAVCYVFWYYQDDPMPFWAQMLGQITLRVWLCAWTALLAYSIFKATT